ncbi:MAG: hypothetical protein E7268_03970 [Lachnospiraceae bacterium]|nr:hypothetical protein [Lachnospiraceae bacterium]
MKKVWIGEGIAILLIIIASIIANKLLPEDRTLPLGVFSACLCLLILAMTVVAIIIPSLFQEIKGTGRKRKKDVSGIIVMVIIILIWLAGTVQLGIRGTRALKDTINGPVEQPIHNTSLKKRHVYRYRGSSTDRYYLYCYTLDEKNELLKVRVNEEKLDKVDTTMLVGSYICESIYGLEEDRYMLYYYENLKILVDLEVLKVEPE